MTHLEYAKKELELAAKMVQNSINEDEEVRKAANELYDLCKASVDRCLARPDLFDVDYDNLEDKIL